MPNTDTNATEINVPEIAEPVKDFLSFDFLGVAVLNFLFVLLLVWFVFIIIKPIRGHFLEQLLTTLAKRPSKITKIAYTVLTGYIGWFTLVSMVVSAYILCFFSENFMNSVQRGTYALFTLIMTGLIFRFIDNYIVPTAQNIWGERKVNYSIFASFAKYFVSFIAAFIILSMFRLSINDVYNMKIPSGVAAILSGVVFIPIATKFITAWFLAFTHKFTDGDYVQIGDTLGIFVSAGINHTTLRGHSGENINIPNKIVASVTTINFGTRKAMRINVPFYISVKTPAELLSETLARFRSTIKQHTECTFVGCRFENGAQGYLTLQVLYDINSIDGEILDRIKNEMLITLMTTAQETGCEMFDSSMTLPKAA